MVSTLFSRNNMNGSVAQLVEQRGHNPLVGGSNPSAAISKP